jgi:predicted nucleic acid-binding Zn ribbon protein
VRRLAPRPIGAALERVVAGAEPATLLARVQGAWSEAAGAALAAEAQPVSEREGVVTVACVSAVWAAELELLGPELAQRVNERLGGGENPPVTRLRFVVGSGPNPS